MTLTLCKAACVMCEFVLLYRQIHMNEYNVFEMTIFLLCFQLQILSQSHKTYKTG